MLLIYVANFQNARMSLITNADVERKPKPKTKGFVGTIKTFLSYIAGSLVSFALCLEGE